MSTRRNRTLRRHRNRKMTRKLAGGKKSGKKWTTAIDAAQKTLSKTGDIEAARKSLRKQALTNARKLFGSVSSSM
jgi:cell division septum initiation protein DivIVA